MGLVSLAAWRTGWGCTRTFKVLRLQHDVWRACAEVLLLTWLLLGTRYALGHWAGAGLAVLGSVLLVCFLDPTLNAGFPHTHALLSRPATASAGISSGLCRRASWLPQPLAQCILCC